MAKEETQIDRTRKADAPYDRLENEVAKIFERHARVAEGFGQLMLLLMQAPRYGHLTVKELSQFVLEPLTKGNILLSRPTEKFGGVDGVSVGAAIWAKVSSEVDERIRKQIEAKNFPVLIALEDWNSGDIHWLLDVVAPSEQLVLITLDNIKSHLGRQKLMVHPTLQHFIEIKNTNQTLSKIDC
jgi:cytolysin-activating lysine-acyltransferase